GRGAGAMKAWDEKDPSERKSTPASPEEQAPRKARNFPESLQYAVTGVLYAFRTQRNLRTHLGLAALVLLFALNFQLTRAEMAVLVLTMGLVVTAELFNTAVELVVDLVT